MYYAHHASEHNAHLPEGNRELYSAGAAARNSPQSPEDPLIAADTP